MAEDQAPDYPPIRLVIDVPLDGDPKVVETGGLASYLLEAIFERLRQDHTTVWELEPAGDPDE